MPFGGDPDRYPHRDEVVAHLTAYADRPAGLGGTFDASRRPRHRHRDGASPAHPGLAFVCLE
ncbi:hypothetical protein [Streptomyces venezuelae]|uniref:hypothetical protein n=1 Tax=Streptomyces venezuelae TaxID=54571 RepID=UPI001CC24EAA|nr:hypothetical protein [Streptomyces venezuelae]